MTVPKCPLTDADVTYIGAENENWEKVRRQEQELFASMKVEKDDKNEEEED